MAMFRKFRTIRIKDYKFVHNTRTRNTDILDISHEVLVAIQSNKPVVALESTIITHGMPYPINLTTAQSVEKIIRQQGAVPATIGVLEGRIKVGLDDSSLMKLASSETSKVKISKCDFPYVLSKGLSGGTTVAGTLIVAKLAGIKIFVTGGIGGVHRDVQDSMDISADLFEISRTPIMVVCSGVKSILDIGKTLEYLETLGVCTAVYGENTHFPAFYSRESGYQSQYNVATPSEAADLLHNARLLDLRSGILLAVPIPKEFSIDNVEIERSIQEGLRLAKQKSIKGKLLTPFLLDCVSNLTNKKSLESNVALIKHNAKVGSQIAISLQQKSSGLLSPNDVSELDRQKRSFSTARCGRPVIIGASIMDCIVRAYEPIQMDGATLAGKVDYNAGGVARNISDALGKLLPAKMSPLFISAIGYDEIGRFLLNSLRHIDKSAIKITTEESTASICVILDENGNCPFLIGSMNIHRIISPDSISKYVDDIIGSSVVVVDGNLTTNTIEHILTLCHESGVPVWFEPSDLNTATKAFLNDRTKNYLRYISPNFKELQMIAHTLTGATVRKMSIETTDLLTILKETRNLVVQILDYVPNIMATLGRYGVLMAHKNGNGHVATLTYYSAHCHSQLNVNNVSGAGDCLAAGYIASMLKGLPSRQCMHNGMSCALTSLESHLSVPASLAAPKTDFELISTEIPTSGEIDRNTIRNLLDIFQQLN